ncbi:MAG TPA: serine/threonine-protein kinase [Gemmatimonadaceae bacterium]|nr:serine/threonine-protein kinase [Gemmatimonadaceae bacterium]
MSSTRLREQLQDALAGAYVVERELGGGGMSRGFVAADAAAQGRRVVVKVLPPELAAGVNAERFAHEVEVAGQLRHPNIVPLAGAGAADGLKYYVMPYVEGESLRARLAARGGAGEGGAAATALPVPEAVRIVREVAAALAYAHAHGVVHRDIKPDNVLLAPDGAVAVTDFGVAKAMAAAAEGRGTLTSVGVALGTPAYMAPEQALAERGADHRVDVYALGSLAYELLAGEPPFGHRSPRATIAAHISERPPSLAERRPEVPGPLDDLVMRCLEKNPARRPQTAEEVLRELTAMLTPSGRVSAVPAPAAALQDADGDLPIPGEGAGRRMGLVVAALMAAIMAVIWWTRRAG